MLKSTMVVFKLLSSFLNSIIGAGKNHQAVEVVAVAHAGGQAVDFFSNRRAFTLAEIFFQTADGFVDQIFQTDGVFFIVGVGAVGRQGEGNAGVGLQALDIFNGVQIHGFSLSCFTLRIIAHIRRATAWMLAAFSGVQAEAARLKPF